MGKTVPTVEISLLEDVSVYQKNKMIRTALQLVSQKQGFRFEPDEETFYICMGDRVMGEVCCRGPAERYYITLEEFSNRLNEMLKDYPASKFEKALNTL